MNRRILYLAIIPAISIALAACSAAAQRPAEDTPAGPPLPVSLSPMPAETEAAMFVRPRCAGRKPACFAYVSLTIVINKASPSSEYATLKITLSFCIIFPTDT